jgi:SfnB family sulfur acquisition oxidoreductase
MTSTLSNPRQAHIIQSDQEAITTAERLAAEFAKQASQRDRQRQLPIQEIQEFSNSGLWGITVPRAYGGAFVSQVTLAEVIKIISEADSNIGQIPQSHFYSVETVRLVGNEQQKQFFFDQVLQGKRFGNAATETGKSSTDIQTRIEPFGDGYRINGRKFYSTGALLADWIPVIAAMQDNKKVVAFVPRGTEGLTIIDDWSSFGQRTTASGTTVLENVYVPKDYVLPNYLAYEYPTALGPFAQIIQAAVDAGIAKAALKETIEFVRQHTRAWSDSGVEHAYEDPLLVSSFGNLQILVHAAEAVLRRAGTVLDQAIAEPNETTVAAASIAVAEAKVLTTEAALQTTNKLFELSGTKSTLQQFNLDRHWRNARVHTLHDPVRWKYYAIGNYYLNHVLPLRHPYL